MSEAISDKPDGGLLQDFPDRLSPMLVKELRQGMRTHLFSVAFILLQAFMVLSVLIGAAAPGGGAGGAVSQFFWFFVVVALLVVMPIRGFGALNAEVQINTMDLIQLTRLTAWRIAFGKWAALVSQTVLLACGILPYLVMRYFFGGIDLAHEILFLFWSLVGSMVLTAVTIGFSAFRSILLRSAIAVGVGLGAISLFGAGIQFVTMRSLSGATASPADFWAGSGLALFLSLFLIYFLIDFGASRIAPDAEIHATRKRLTGLGVAVAILVAGGFWVDWQWRVVLAAGVLGLVCLDAVTERPSLLPSVLRPFARRLAIRPFAMVLAPGWHTGILFFLLCMASIFVLVWYFEGGPTSGGWNLETWQIAVSLAGVLVFPLLIVQLFFSRLVHGPAFFGLYVLIQCGVFLLSLFLMVVADTPVGEAAYLIFPIPMVAWFAAVSNDESIELLGISAGFLALTVAASLWRAAPLFRTGHQIMKVLREEAKGAGE